LKVSNYGLEQIGIMAKVVHCHDCGILACSPEETRAYGFCHLKVFDARRRVIGGGETKTNNKNLQQAD
jgi:hypothetical protein